MRSQKHRSIETKNHEKKKIKEIDMNVVQAMFADIKKQL